MNKGKLRWKVFGFLLGFCGLLLLILWLLQTVFLTDMYKMVRRHEMDKAIVSVEEVIEKPEFHQVLKNLEEEKEILVMPTKEFEPIPENRKEEKERRKPETITQIKEFTLKSGGVISLTFHAMITPVNATVSTLKIQLTIITLLLFFAAIFLAVMLSKKIAKPIADINQKAKLLAEGNYDVIFEGNEFLEVKELADTLNAAAAELGKTEHFRRELLANISHDLKTPLSLIYSYAEMMQDFPQEISAEQTTVIMEEVKRLTSLVDDAMDISKLESNMMELHRKYYNLTESIRNVIERVKKLLKTENYNILFSYEEEVYILADEVKITQAFYNLLLNAVHYCGEKKEIKIVQRIEKGEIVISVSDDGEGIAKDELDNIWERYYKTNKIHKRALTGTGLGLSIVKKMIQLHGGSCGVYSKEGEGSTFFIRLRMGEIKDV